MSNLTPTPQYLDDEINVFELASALWAEKWVIIATTALTTICAVAYALLATPIYEASARVMPPLQSEVVGYNVGRLTMALKGGDTGNSSETLPHAYTPADVYEVFQRALLSQQTRNSFFEKYYLPYVGIDAASERLEIAARDQLQRRFAKILIVNQPDALNRSGECEVRVELKDPVLAAEWANLYVDMAAKRAERLMINNVATDLRSRAAVAVKRMETLVAMAKQEREDRISRLQEALQIARALGLEDAQVSAGRTSADSELAAFVEGDLMYLRGTKALQAELDVLQARTNDTPFISGYRILQTRADALENLVVDTEKVAVFTLDSAAEVPETPIKPKKMLIVALGLVIGSVLGGMIALTRIAMRSWKEKQ